MYTRFEDDRLEAVVLGCYDCLFRITAAPSKCILLNREFKLLEINEYKIRRLNKCPLPTNVLVRVVAHPCSEKEGKREKEKDERD